MPTANISAPTKDRILKAALQLFSRNGFTAATTKDIAKEASVAEVTLFRHFPSKEILLQEVMSRYAFVADLRELREDIRSLDCEGALQHIANNFVAILVERQDWFRLLHSELQRSPASLRNSYHKFLDELFDGFAACFSDLQKRDELRDFDLGIGARAFYGLFMSYFYQEELLLRKKYKATKRSYVIQEYVKILLYGWARQPSMPRGRDN